MSHTWKYFRIWVDGSTASILIFVIIKDIEGGNNKGIGDCVH